MQDAEGLQILRVLARNMAWFLRLKEADTVIISVGFRPLPSMKEQLEMSDIDIYQVGDGREVGSIMTAIWEAYEVAHSI